MTLRVSQIGRGCVKTQISKVRWKIDTGFVDCGLLCGNACAI